MQRVGKNTVSKNIGVFALLFPLVCGCLLAESSDGVSSRGSSDPSARASAPSLQHVQFRGLLQLNEAWRFSLKDLDENISFWVGIGETAQGIEAKSYDPEEEVLTIGYLGREHRLTLTQSDPAPLAVVASKATVAADSSEFELPAAPQFKPPPPPNGGRPPSAPPPGEPPPQPAAPQ